MAQKFAQEAGESLSISSKTLHKRLDDRHKLVTKDDKRGRLLIRKTLEGSVQNVLHLAASSTVRMKTSKQQA